MPFCENCGTELEENSKFCTNCGLPIEALDDPVAEDVEQTAFLVPESVDEKDAEAVAAIAATDPDPKPKKPKKKAVIGAIVGLVVVLGVFGALLGTKTICFHDWCEATYSLPKTCIKCGKTEGFALVAPEMEWPTGGISKYLPTADVEFGKVLADQDHYIHAALYRASLQDFKGYVAACEKAGYKIDYNEGDLSFGGENAKGYRISVSYGGDVLNLNGKSDWEKERAFNNFKTIDIALSAPKEPEPEVEPDPEPEPKAEPKKDSGSSSSSSNSSSSSGLRKDFKKAMDDYEAFVDDYCAFMKKYAKNPTDTSLLNDYNKMIQKELEMTASFEKWADKDLNDAELEYFTKVQGRTSQKLLDAATSMY